MSGCPYRYALGIPGQGVHSTRFLGFAVFDWVATFLLAGFTAFITKTGFLSNLFFWFIIGEILHYYYGTQTAFLTLVGLRPEC
jgi:hypothetical protein